MISFPLIDNAPQHAFRQSAGRMKGGRVHMIEIIREEEWEGTDRRELPKDIKQIGKPDIGDRIYVENKVYEYLHSDSGQWEKTVYVLLGRFENFTGKQCIFLEAVIRLEEMEFESELPVWNDQTWAYIYKQLKKEYDNMAIVGWALDLRGQLPNLDERIETLHQRNFGGTHQVLLLMDTLEQEEMFFGNRNGHLYQREGFYIYFDRRVPESTEQNAKPDRWEQEPEHPEEPVVDVKPEEKPVKEELKGGSYRKQILARVEKQQPPSYASSFLLLVVVGVLGVTAYLNYQKMNAMEATLAQMNQASINTEATETEQDTVRIEQVPGNVERQDAVPENEQNGTVGEPADAQTGDTADPAVTDLLANAQDGAADPGAESQGEAPQEPADVQETMAETTPVTSEAQVYLEQGYYIVQKGDSLMGICKKIYQTTAMLEKLCEVNGIENQDAIYAGQYLTLPN